jgi:putative ABC transport system permease protein
VFVGPRDARSFDSGGPPSLPASLEDRIGSVPGVAETGAVVSALGILRLHDKRVATLMVGFEPGRLGGPWKMHEGRPPRGRGEITVDRVLADGHGLSLGDMVMVRGRELRIVGLTDKTASWMTPLVFTTRREAAAMQDAAGSASYVLARANGASAERVAAELRQRLPNANIMTRSELSDNDRELIGRAFDSPLMVMVLTALGVGSIVIAITTYGFVAERRREFGALKAIGAPNSRLYGVVSTQALSIAVLALIAGTALQQGTARAIEAVWPKFLFVSLPGHYVFAIVAAVLMGLVGGLVPARVLARLDPAEVFRR